MESAMCQALYLYCLLGTLLLLKYSCFHESCSNLRKTSFHINSLRLQAQGVSGYESKCMSGSSCSHVPYSWLFVDAEHTQLSSPFCFFGDLE